MLRHLSLSVWERDMLYAGTKQVKENYHCLLREATLNITTSAIYEVAAMVCALILPRLILSHFGSAYNGIVSSVTQFLTLISLLTLGVTASTRVALYQSLAAKDLRKTSAIVRATNNYMRKVGLAPMLHGFIISALVVLVALGVEWALGLV